MNRTGPDRRGSAGALGDGVVDIGPVCRSVVTLASTNSVRARAPNGGYAPIPLTAPFSRLRAAARTTAPDIRAVPGSSPMDPQIHGAIVGGAIGGLTVVLGVGVEWSVTRLRDRRADVEAAAAELAMLLPRRPMRHAKKIRAAARLTYAKFIALTYEWQTRRRPIEQEEPDRPCARLEEDPQHARGHLRRADRDSDQVEANPGSATSTKSLIVPSPAPGGVYLSRMVSSA
jgi:hypothetical protein